MSSPSQELYLLLLHDGAEFSKINPSFFVDKASCTRQFESEFSLHLLASLFPIKEGIFSNPSVSLSKGSSTSNQAFSIVFTTPSVPLVGDRNLRRKDVTALQCYICPTCPSPGGGSLPYTLALNPYHRD